MMSNPETVSGLLAALGIGLLIGLDRERRKGAGGGRSPGGVRTFSVASISGAVAYAVGAELMLAVAASCVGALAVAAYMHSKDKDPGITTEVALVLNVLLGGLAMQQPSLAVGIAVVVTVLLASRSILHSFVRDTLTEREIQDGLIFATAALVIWPLLPDRPLGPLAAVNLKSLWMLVVLVMGVGAAGYVTTRLLGPHYGLPLIGLASGFVSSIATIGSMGERAKATPAMLGPAVAGATLSTVATIVQFGILLFAISPPTLQAAAPALACAGLAALVYGAIFTRTALASETLQDLKLGRVFDPKSALILAGVFAAISIATSAFNQWFGTKGVLIGVAIAGFADTHAAAAAAATLVAEDKLTAQEAVAPILAGMAANTVSKAIMAASSGTRAFAVRVIPGLALVMFAALAGAWIWM